MKRILGLDLGTNSIGWALVNEAETKEEKSLIVKLGVRTISYDNFVSTETGKACMDADKDFRGEKEFLVMQVELKIVQHVAIFSVLNCVETILSKC